MIEKLEQAMSILEDIADIRFDYLGETDAELTDYTDGLVVVGWEESDETFIARAGPRFGDDHSQDVSRVGYATYFDGSVRFNSSSLSDQTLVVFIHELIHLLGLGHSENPVSIMHNDSFYYELPQPDDIDALQALYGPPDEFVRPNLELQFSSDNPPPGVAVNFNSGFYLYDPESSDGEGESTIITEIDLDEDLSRDDLIKHRISWSGISDVDDVVSFHVVSPNGYTRFRYSTPATFSSAVWRVILGDVDILSNEPGTWKIVYTVEDEFLAEADLEVISDGPDYNRTPVVEVDIESSGEGTFEIQVSATDEEEDEIEINWNYPDSIQDQELVNGRILNLEPGSNPVQLFIEVRDNVERDDDSVSSGSSHGDGYGALVNKYLVTPAEPLVPTFFTATNIFHIPAYEHNGSIKTANLKLTALEGVVLKFIEEESLENFNNEAAFEIDSETNQLTIPRLIVNDNGFLAEFNDVRFRLLVDSQPLKIELLE